MSSLGSRNAKPSYLGAVHIDSWWKAMCDEYDDERMVAFWRRLEQLEGRKQTAPAFEGVVEPPVIIEPTAGQPSKTKARLLTR